MTGQEKQRIDFPLAFEIYSQDVNWNNPPLISEYPYFKKDIWEILLNCCLDHFILDYILLPTKKSIISQLFFKEQERLKIFTDKQRIRQQFNYFMNKIYRNDYTVIGTSGDISTFLSIFNQAYYAIDDISIEHAMYNINSMIGDTLTLSTINKLPCKSLLFINHDGEPIYLLEYSHYSQIVGI